MRYSRMLIGVFAVLSGFQTIAKAQMAVCEILARNAIHIDKVEDNEDINQLFLHEYCSDSTYTKEKATSSGWNLGLPIEGIPIELAFNQDGTQNEENRVKLCSHYEASYSRKTVIQIYKQHPDILAYDAVNECLAIATASGNGLRCSIKSEDADQNLYGVTLINTVSSVQVAPKISSAFLVNAKPIGMPSALGSNGEASVSIFEGKTLTPQVTNFLAQRTALGTIIFNLVADDGRSVQCIEKQQPDRISVHLQPEGNSVYRMDFLVFGMEASTGCGKGYSTFTQVRCAPDVIIKDIRDIGVISSRCPGSASYANNQQILVNPATNIKQCISLDMHVRGCGREFGNCKGSGKLVLKIVADRLGIGSPLPSLNQSHDLENGISTSAFVFTNRIQADAIVRGITAVISIERTILYNGISRRETIPFAFYTEKAAHSACYESPLDKAFFMATLKWKGHVPIVMVGKTIRRGDECGYDPKVLETYLRTQPIAPQCLDTNDFARLPRGREVTADDYLKTEEENPCDIMYNRK